MDCKEDMESIPNQTDWDNLCSDINILGNLQ